ncbi:Glycerol kinase [Posidoniimonas polymericola]|uniref:Glycerol kinase n=1 Tax=Posidoniimonas polymericola TaxID=2528002 RepID=A0A5C5ZF11_9BACT|nr:glycerol kinase GlpK [Posidoniimonas polymericola]TWT85431.1 Glycerol kinase [Posidoniimonas polymericola]
MTYLLALDQGTTSSRAIVFDTDGAQVAVAQREFQQHYPQPGWVEHDANEIWATQRDVAIEALAKAGLKAADIAALGIVNQRETLVVWDRATGEPVCRAIVWQDRRTAAMCRQLKDAEPIFRTKTGLLLDPYFTGTKLAWLLDNEPGLRARAEAGELAAGTIDSWLVYKLTNGKQHVTDASNASRTLLLNLQTCEWDNELLDILRVPAALLPAVVDSSGVCGEVSGVDELNGIAIAGLAGDQQSALFGQACFGKGDAKNTYGTGSFLLVNTGTEVAASHQKLLSTVGWRIGGVTEYALEGSVFVTGAAVQWLRDGLGIIKQSADVEALANQVPDTGDVYLVPAFAGLGAPHWDPDARGTIVGMTRGTTAAHIARATLEGIALQSVELAEAMRADTGLAIDELRVDGGAASNDTLMQMQADLLQAKVIRPKVTETTALGAAYLAGLAVGVWPDRPTLAKQWAVDREFEPQISADEAAAKRARWGEAVERAKGWAADD